jgi:PcfJ-like protein
VPCRGRPDREFGDAPLLGHRVVHYFSVVVHLLPTANMCFIGGMPGLRDLGDGLGVSRTVDGLEFRFPGDRTGLQFERVEGRVSACLTFAGSRMRADVSFQPGAVVHQIDQTAREHGVDPNRWRGAVLMQLREWSGQLDWCRTDPGRLLAAIGALAHPLLGHVYVHDRQPLGEVPRWALGVLRCNEPLAAARVLAGDGANRRLARVLAHSLLSAGDGGHVQLGPLGQAVIGKDMTTADEMANVLEVPTTAGPERWPSVDDVRVARQGLGLYPPERRAALLVDIARHHDGRALAEAMTHLWWVRDRADHPLPVRLDVLRQMCRRLVPVIASPAERPSASAPAATRPQRPAQRPATPEPAPGAMARIAAEPLRAVVTAPTPAPVQRPPSRPDAVPRPAPPSSNPTAPVPTRWSVPAALMGVHQLQRDGLRFTVPTSTDEVASWGVTLHNCLARYARAAAEQRSWLIGIERDDELIGCIEVVPPIRMIRQALGPRNRPLPTGVYDIATRVLLAGGVIRALAT